MANHIISVYFQDGIEEIFLPNIDNTVISHTISPLISSFRHELQLTFEVWDSEWKLRSTDTVELYVESRRVEIAPLRKDIVILGRLRGTEDKFSIIVHENFDSYTMFNKYIFDRNVSIGANPSNIVQFNTNNLVSGEHSVLYRETGGKCVIKDLGSRNGTFLNGQRIKRQAELSYGDIVYIVGLKIVYLKDMLAISMPYEGIKIHNLRAVDVEDDDRGGSFAPPEVTFARSPRQMEQLNVETVEIEAPPVAPKHHKPPLIFNIGPSFSMIIPMAVGLLFMLLVTPQNNGSGNPYIFMGVIISGTAAIVAVFWAIMNFFYSERSEKLEEARRSEEYSAYMNIIADNLRDKRERNRSSLLKSYPPAGQCVKWIESSPHRLWERSPRHDDFLSLRLGCADIPFLSEVRIPKQSLATITDKLGKMPEEIRDEFSIIKNAPILLELRKHRLVGISTNDRSCALGLARMLSAQLAFSHAYTETRMAFIFNNNENEWFSHTRWLPHAWNENGDLRLVANDKNTATEVLYFLSESVKSRTANQEPNVNRREETPLPYYVVFISSLEMVADEPAYKALLSAVSGKTDVGVALILLCNKIDKLPAECTAIIEEQDSRLRLFSLNNEFTPVDNIAYDRVDAQNVYESARRLSGYFINETDRKSGLPKMVTYLDMLGVLDTSGLDIYRRWLQNRSYQSLRAPLGINGAGKLFYLDIHEKHHGPHGIIAGTTGSGKSEFLQTYILSMALNYHPNEAAFLLIDYKGGDMARFFANLPHTAGIITNLDGNGIVRALASIKAEIANRQRIFNQTQVRHIDEYIELFRLSKVSAPLPRLIIIADEFAELKKDNPEFIRELISASRVGRSLGVHLILATQQPSVAVDGEIRANSKFGVSLRVNDRHESISMIGRPNAAFIQPAQTGRGFFQVGNDDIFEEFQAAWSGARYEPDKRNGAITEKTATMINIQGRPEVIWNDAKEPGGKDSRTQISAVVEAIIKTAEMNGVSKVRSTWLAPLPKRVDLSMIHTEADPQALLPAFLGLADEPSLQRQSPVLIDIAQTGHILICGGAMSGKTMLIETMLMSAAESCPPDRLNIYIADYTSRLLSIFSKLPQTGGVVLAEDVDKSEKLIKLLYNCLAERKRRFAEKGVGSYRDYVRVSDDLPAIFFVIDGLPEFAEANIKSEESIITIAKEGASLGVYIIASCGGLGEVRGRLKNYFTFNIGLGLGDKFDYSQTLGERCEFAAEKNIPGRGMVKNPTPVEFQAALPVAAVAEGLRTALLGEITAIADIYGLSKVKPIPSVPDKPDYDSFMSAAPPEKDLVPLGYDMDEADIVSIDLNQTYCYAICGQQRTGKTNALKLLMKRCLESGAKVYLFDDKNSPFAELADKHITDAEELYKFSREILIPEFTIRNKKDSSKHNGEPIFVFIHDLLSFSDSVYNEEYPMSGFYESIFNTGASLNIRFVGALLVTAVNDRVYSNALRNFLAWRSGLLLGGKVIEQNIFDFDIPLTDSAKKLPSGVGYTFAAGKTVKIKLPLVKEAN